VFIVWDRLFGTFADETEPVRYGVTTPVRTFDPLRLQFSWWRLLWADAVATRSWWDKLRLWWMPTGWRPADVAERPWPKMGAEKFDCAYPAGLRVYAFVQFVAINALTLVYLASVRQAGWLLPLLLGPLILCGCISLGRLFEGRRGLWRLEAVRLVLLAALALAWGLWLAPAQWALAFVLAGLCAASLLWLVWLAARPQPVAQA
jgi:hypothetical protein